MIGARPTALLIAAVATFTAAACGPKRVSAPTRPGQALVVLLPDADGTTGQARVWNDSGSASLDHTRDATLATPRRRPGAVGTLNERDVTRIFGEALAALPPAPRRFTLYFRFESNELTDESRALLPEILITVRQQPVPDLVVVGHTDTMGTPAANFDLGIKRATAVSDLLVEAGLDLAAIEVTSLGEADLLLRTPDETPEPRNRRVDILVR
jgi:outer membrane protein OmpA-like peptidoglycan-associated protein